MNYFEQFRFILRADFDYCDKTTALNLAKTLGYFTYYFDKPKLTIAEVIKVWKEEFGEDKA